MAPTPETELQLEENPSEYSYLIGEEVMPLPGWFGEVTGVKEEGMVEVSFSPDACVGTYSGKFIEESLTAPVSKPTPLPEPVEIAVGTEVEIWEGGDPDRARVGTVTERIRERTRASTTQKRGVTAWDRYHEESAVILDATSHNIYRVDFPFDEETKRFDGPWGSPFWEYGGKFLQDKRV